ncbi:L,D-transpeptidase family protein [Halobacillus campisalis]|uniref:L,D-transpeptidase family protein n=1 Tax=Halobacillus campisalis TaxID=435909 RepID=A0ABW2K528_9BACI|nr:L,D-transpeptidase family protein [Halobacillus campisalis]
MFHIVKPDETLSQISRDYRTPLSTILAANPGINPNIIYPGQSIEIPGIPPASSIPYQIGVSLSGRHLNLLKDGVLQKQYPIAVGSILNNTPIGQFIIINKAPNPGGPYGTMWMSLSKQYYGIHGTNDPSSIGKAVSKGCIRMYNNDVEELARTIPVGTPVFIHP